MTALPLFQLVHFRRYKQKWNRYGIIISPPLPARYGGGLEYRILYAEPQEYFGGTSWKTLQLITLSTDRIGRSCIPELDSALEFLRQAIIQSVSSAVSGSLQSPSSNGT